MAQPPVGRIEFDGVDPFYRPAGAPIKPSIPTMEDGFRECIEAYAAQNRQTVDELKADDIWPVRCRCKPGTDNPHCGGFFVAKGSMETVDGGVQVHRSVPLTSVHTPTTGEGEPIVLPVVNLPIYLAAWVTKLREGQRGEFIDRLKAMMCLNCCRVYDDGNPMPPRCQCWNDE